MRQLEKDVQAHLPLSTGICLMLIPSVPSTSQLLASSRDYGAVRRLLWRAGIEGDDVVLSCLLQLFPHLPSSLSAVINGIQNELVPCFVL